jgi:hypothetical protein
MASKALSWSQQLVHRREISLRASNLYNDNVKVLRTAASWYSRILQLCLLLEGKLCFSARDSLVCQAPLCTREAGLEMTPLSARILLNRLLASKKLQHGARRRRKKPARLAGDDGGRGRDREVD